MHMNEQSIIERVRKVLNLARNAGTEGEAAAAMARASDILAKHNLTMVEIDSAPADSSGCIDSLEPVTRQSFARPGRLWKVYLQTAAATLNFCTIYTQRRGGTSSIMLVGRPNNIAVATMTADYLTTTVERLASNAWHEMGQGKRGSFIRSFSVGAATDIYWRAKRMQRDLERDAEPINLNAGSRNLPTVAGLYRSEATAVQAFLRADGIRLGRVNSSRSSNLDASAYNAGKTAGANVSLSRQVGASGGRLRIGSR